MLIYLLLLFQRISCSYGSHYRVQHNFIDSIKQIPKNKIFQILYVRNSDWWTLIVTCVISKRFLWKGRLEERRLNPITSLVLLPFPRREGRKSTKSYENVRSVTPLGSAFRLETTYCQDFAHTTFEVSQNFFLLRGLSKNQSVNDRTIVSYQ